MKAAYFNCIGGVSGDMVLGALVDTGLSIDSLRNGAFQARCSGLRYRSLSGLPFLNLRHPRQREDIGCSPTSPQSQRYPFTNKRKPAGTLSERKGDQDIPPTGPGRVPRPPCRDRSGPLPRGRRRRCHSGYRWCCLWLRPPRCGTNLLLSDTARKRDRKVGTWTTSCTCSRNRGTNGPRQCSLRPSLPPRSLNRAFHSHRHVAIMTTLSEFTQPEIRVEDRRLRHRSEGHG